METILASEVNSRSEKLRFAVTDTLEGRGGTLKAQVIAASHHVNRLDWRNGESASVRADARRRR